MKHLLALALTCYLPMAASAGVVETIDTFIESQSIDKSQPGWKTGLRKPPKVEFDTDKSYYWNLETNVGSIKIKLLPDVAPMHVSSTIYLVRLGFYDGLTFHRVISQFMAQGGDPQGNGCCGPGYNYRGEFSDKVKHNRPGLLSMANSGPGTDGSQFFLTFVKTPWLDRKHTIFGEVAEGMETVKVLEGYGSQSGQPSKMLEMIRSTISVE
ncbi:MAG: peptidylprolyl isomerase [Gammaproteobacteria bacterium]|nr:peptidylprolyl isomerase [Gammaproteobacteria bacterium]